MHHLRVSVAKREKSRDSQSAEILQHIHCQHHVRPSRDLKMVVETNARKSASRTPRNHSPHGSNDGLGGNRVGLSPSSE